MVYLSHPKPSWYTSLTQNLLGIPLSPKTFLVYLSHPKPSWYTSLTQNLLGIPLSPKTFLVYLSHPKPSWYTSLTQNLLGIPLSPKTFLVYLSHPKPSWYTSLTQNLLFLTCRLSNTRRHTLTSMREFDTGLPKYHPLLQKYQLIFISFETVYILKNSQSQYKKKMIYSLRRRYARRALHFFCVWRCDEKFATNSPRIRREFFVSWRLTLTSQPQVEC